jgi:hypothetical protein
LSLTIAFPTVGIPQAAAPLSKEQLVERVEALRPFACDAAGTAAMRAKLLEYQQQLKTQLQSALQDPVRQTQLAQLSPADREVLSQAWTAKISALDTTCSAAQTAVNPHTEIKAPPVVQAPDISIPVPAEARGLADKVLGKTTIVPPMPRDAAAAAMDINQEVIQGLAVKRSQVLGELTAEPMELIFDPQDVATKSDPKSVKLTNNSGQDLFLLNTSVPGRNFQVAENDCASKLPNQGTCNIKVVFEPFTTDIHDMLSSLLVTFKDNSAATTSNFIPVTLRGSAIHWKFPFTRAVAGLDVSAISSKPTNFHYFVEFNLTAPVGRLIKHKEEADPLNSRLWVFLNPRITSVPTTSSAIDNLNPSLDSFNSLITTNLTKVAQGVDANIGMELALLKPRDGIAWWSDFPNSHAKLAVSAVLGGGAITPFSSDKTQQIAVLNQSILDAYPGQVAPLLPAACTNGNNLIPGCPITFITFLTPERSRFFRKYYGGFRVKTFFFNEDVPGECSPRWKENHPNSCDAPYNIFPGTFDITVGQDESITGGSFHGMIWRLDAVYPLHFLPSLHVFGSLYGTFQKNKDSIPFQLVTPSNTDTLTDLNTLRFVVPIQNRDYYRIGLGVDLIQLFKRNDAGQPGTANTPTDKSKTAANN